MNRAWTTVGLVLLAAALTLTACARPGGVLIVATTTSTADTGLLDVLNAEFKRLHPQWEVKTIAVGTGEALKIGERGDCDVVLVHARAAEDAFVAAGYGRNRRDVMYNDFVLLGPPNDPAGVGQESTAGAAFARLHAVSALFVSRGDNSGTHQRELALWKAAGVGPGGPGYISTGQGMGATLRIASDKGGYTLSDRGTYLATANLTLVVVLEGDPALRNDYGVIEVIQARNPVGARAYADFLVSPATQAIIAGFGREQYGQPLFFPAAGGK